MSVLSIRDIIIIIIIIIIGVDSQIINIQRGRGGEAVLGIDKLFFKVVGLVTLRCTVLATVTLCTCSIIAADIFCRSHSTGHNYRSLNICPKTAQKQSKQC